MICPTLPAGADPTLSSTLLSLDCRVNGLVSGGYARLFGADGALNAALTTVLTIYVLLIGYTLMTGRMRISLPSLTPKVATLALVLTFATAWPAYQAVVYGLLAGGPDQIASIFMGESARGGAARAFATRLDSLFDALVEMGRAVSAAGDPNSESVKLASNLAWTSAIVTLLSTVGLLVISRIVLAVLLALGPVFVVFALFKPTRGLFEGWLKTSAAFAFAPMLVVLGGSGLVAMMEPMIAPIAADPAAAVQDPRGLVTLFVTAVVYAALLPTLGMVSLNLTRSWRTGSDRTSNGGDRPASAGSAEASASAFGPAASSALPDDRVAGVVASALQDGGNASTSSSLVLDRAVAVTDSTPPPRQTSSSREPGLGQSFRPVSSVRMISGKIGS